MTLKEIRPPADIDALLKDVAETVNNFNMKHSNRTLRCEHLNF